MGLSPDYIAIRPAKEVELSLSRVGYFFLAFFFAAFFAGAFFFAVAIVHLFVGRGVAEAPMVGPSQCKAYRGVSARADATCNAFTESRQSREPQHTVPAWSGVGRRPGRQR